MLASRFADGDEAQLMEGIQQVQPIVAIKVGDLAELRRLLEVQGLDPNAGDYVSGYFLLHS